MEKNDIIEYIKKFFAVIAMIGTPYMVREIMLGQYDSRSQIPIQFYYEPALWVGTLFLAVFSFVIGIKMWGSADETKKFIKDISIFIQYIGIIILHQTAKYYRPSKLHETTDEYIFWVLFFWLAMLWLIVYVIITGVISEAKRQNKV